MPLPLHGITLTAVCSLQLSMPSSLHVCAAACNALTTSQGCPCAIAEAAFGASSLPSAVTWTTLGCLEGRISAVPCCPVPALSRFAASSLHENAPLCHTVASGRGYCKQLPDAGPMMPCRWHIERLSGSLVLLETKQDPCKSLCCVAGGRIQQHL